VGERNRLTMKPVMQTQFGKADGNCYAACLASILEIPIDSVPPCRQCNDESDQMAALRQQKFYREWARTMGFVLINVEGDFAAFDRVFMVAGGRGPRGIGHAVVWRGGKCVHDPFPGGGGLTGEPDEYEILVPMNPARRKASMGLER